MRIAPLVIAASILGAACAHESGPYERNRYDRRDRDARAQAFEAYTTDGHTVVVQEDPRSGALVIAEPAELRGQPVTVIDRWSDGRPVVSRDVRNRGAGGDADWGRRDDDHRNDDHR